METTNGNIGNCCKCGGCNCQQKKTQSSEGEQAKPIYCNAQPFASHSYAAENEEIKGDANSPKKNKNQITEADTNVELSPDQDKALKAGVTLIKVPEIELRYVKPANLNTEKKLNSSGYVAELFREIIGNERILIQEYFVAFYLNRRNRPVGYYILSKGGIAGTIVDVRLLILAAVKSLASGIIILHNHPGGETDPSDKDKEITLKIRDAAKLLDISLIDHLIVTTTSYYSFSDEGLFGPPESAIDGINYTIDEEKRIAPEDSELQGFRAEAQKFLDND